MVLRGLKPKKLQNIMAPNKLSMSAAKSKSLCRVKFMVTHRIGSTLLKLGHINNHRVRRFHTRKPNKGNGTSNLLHYNGQIIFLTTFESWYRFENTETFILSEEMLSLVGLSEDYLISF